MCYTQRRMYPLARLAAALANPEPQAALRNALAIAREVGIVQAERGAAAWVTFSCEERSLCLSLDSEREAPVDLACWADLLRAAFARAVEHERFVRVCERSDLFAMAAFEGLFLHVEGYVVDVNPRLVEMSGGYTREELLGDGILRCIASEDLALVHRRIAERYEGEYVVTAIRKDGTRFIAELHARQGALGPRSVRTVSVRDVTEREQIVSLLRESEQRMRALIGNTFDMIVFIRDGVVIEEIGAEGTLGFPREHIIGREVLAFVTESSRSEVTQALATQRDEPYEALLLTASGEALPMELVPVRTTLHGEPIRMTAMRDLRAAKREEEKRRALERAFEQSQRLESLGVLAGGIAHDFNNLLAVVLGHAELLQLRVRDPEACRLARDISSAAQRAAGLTRQILAYAGRGELGPRTAVDVAALVAELRSLLAAGLSKKARISLALCEGSVVLGNRATLTQVLMNLLTNASDALRDEAGEIEVRTCRVDDPDARFVRALGQPVQPGKWLLIEVRDTGVGMDEATQARIFDPFFSTKPNGHGLGLAACVGIVSSHGGAILVESRLGKGSTFSVLLPRHDEAPERRSAPHQQARVSKRSVLVVDDEPLVRANVRAALSLHGYEVDEADSGTMVLERLEHTQPSVILLDMTMPDLSGIDVLQRIRARGLGIPVVFTSGYHDVAIELDPTSFQGFVVKPYRLQVLFEALDRALETVAVTEPVTDSAPV